MSSPRPRSPRPRIAWLAACALFLIGGVFAPLTAASATPAVGDVGIVGGLHAPDEHLTAEEDFLDDIVPTVGLRGAWFLAEDWAVAVDGLFSSVATGGPEGDATMLSARGAAEWFPRGSSIEESRWFLSGGVGWMNVSPDEGDSFGRPFAAAGVGQRVPLPHHALFRWELRGDATFGDADDFVGEDMIQAELLVGLGWAFGRAEPDVDTDGDGVWDRLDVCPDTPAGATVDATGCPRDSDGDGVLDGLDRCPDTPAGATADPTGCPLDTDGDGILDGLDRCPDTAAGAAVDADGCAKPTLFEEDRAELVLEGVTFETRSDTITEEGRAALDRVAEALKAWPEVRVEIGGHTDSRGNAELNRRLSERRAQSVMRYLLDAGVSFTQLTAKGYGETESIADNGTPEGRQENRRVELKRIDW